MDDNGDEGDDREYCYIESFTEMLIGKRIDGDGIERSCNEQCTYAERCKKSTYSGTGHAPIITGFVMQRE
jgi:hypothetical protein